MKLNHEDIKEKLPEYIRAEAVPDEVKTHFEKCIECSQEISLLQALNEATVPEPGNMFFETLPQKVRISLKKKKSFLLRMAPAFALIAVAVVTGFIYHVTSKPHLDNGFLFSDPFASQVYELSGLSPDDLPSISDTIQYEEIYLSEETPFHWEFAALSSEEMKDLNENLKIKKENGGAL